MKRQRDNEKTTWQRNAASRTWNSQ